MQPKKRMLWNYSSYAQCNARCKILLKKHGLCLAGCVNFVLNNVCSLMLRSQHTRKLGPFSLTLTFSKLRVNKWITEHLIYVRNSSCLSGSRHTRTHTHFHTGPWCHCTHHFLLASLSFSLWPRCDRSSLRCLHLFLLLLLLLLLLQSQHQNHIMAGSSARKESQTARRMQGRRWVSSASAAAELYSVIIWVKLIFVCGSVLFPAVSVFSAAALAALHRALGEVHTWFCNPQNWHFWIIVGKWLYHRAVAVCRGKYNYSKY